MAHFLIAGAAGFIGSHLCNYYLNKGHKITGVDDYTSSSPNSNHIKNLLLHPNFNLIVKDIRNIKPEDYYKYNFDYILNFACPASPPNYQNIPIKTLTTSVIGTQNLLEIANYNRAKFLQASTSEIYGNPTVTPQPESYRGYVNSYGPRSCYDEGKRAAESLCYDYRFKLGLDVRVIRIFNTYGPHMQYNDGRVITNFIYQALNNKPLTIYGNGDQTRSFCYIDDLINGINCVLMNTNNYGPVNLGNPDEFTVYELGTLVHKLLNKDSYKFNYKPIPVDDPLQRKPDITLAKEKLDWKPLINLRSGLLKTIKYFSNN
jgi:UDP-glucuronate decarboxylase